MNGERTCRRCGQEFTPKPRSRSRFCGQECITEYCREVAKAHARRIGQRVTRTCRQCGQEFECKAHDVRRGRGRFCSESCAARWGNEHRPAPLPSAKG